MKQPGSAGVSHENSEKKEVNTQQGGEPPESFQASKDLKTSLEKGLSEAIAGKGLSWSRKRTLTNIEIARDVVQELLGEIPLQAIGFTHEMKLLDNQQERMAIKQNIGSLESEIQELKHEIEELELSLQWTDRLTREALKLVPIYVNYASNKTGAAENDLHYIQLKNVTDWKFLDGKEWKVTLSETLPFPGVINESLFTDWRDLENPLTDFFIAVKADSWTQDNIVVELLKPDVRKGLGKVLLDPNFLADNFDKIFIVAPTSERLIYACQTFVNNMILLNERVQLLDPKKDVIADLKEQIDDKQKAIRKKLRKIDELSKHVEGKDEPSLESLEVDAHKIRVANEQWTFSWRLGSTLANLVLEGVYKHYTYEAGDPAPNPVKAEVLTNMTINSEVDLAELELETEKAKNAIQ